MNIADVLTDAEMVSIREKSDLRGAWVVSCQWLSTIAVFAFVAYWPHPLTFLLGVAFLGGRKLGFGVLTHECGHRILFRTPWLNEFVGVWVVAPPGFGNMKAYMRGHLEHHRQAGTRQDPDLPNYRDYPITRKRLRRKLKRDITGQTGWRQVKSIGTATGNIRQLNPESRACLLRGLVMNGLILGTLMAAGQGWLYLMWVGAFVFTQPLVSRVRQIAEHAAVPDLYDPDPRKNTRTLYAGPVERMIFCPHGVNYHLEHHFLASVPIYRLKEMHRLLLEKGVYSEVEFPRGYYNLLRKVTLGSDTLAPA